MLNRINEETKKQEWFFVLTGSDPKSDDCVSGEGIGVNDQCSLTYKFENSGYKRTLLSMKGSELIRRSIRILNHHFVDMKPDGSYPDTRDIKEVSQMFTTMYSTGLIHPHHFRKMKQDPYCNQEVWTIINRSLKKRKGPEYEMVLDFMCCYLHWKIRQNSILSREFNEEDLRTSNHLEVVDCDYDKEFFKELQNKDSKSYWKKSPFVERHKIKTFNEFLDLVKGGFLRYQWI